MNCGDSTPNPPAIPTLPKWVITLLVKLKRLIPQKGTWVFTFLSKCPGPRLLKSKKKLFTSGIRLLRYVMPSYRLAILFALDQ